MTDDSMDLPLVPLGERRFLARGEKRAKLLRDAISWLIVLLIHLGFFAVILFSEPVTTPLRIVEQETILVLPPLRNEQASPTPAVRSEGRQPMPSFRTAPIILPPMIPAPTVPSAEDILRAIGAELACGASSYENLTEYARENCRHIPWMPMRAPNGSIVLAPQAPPSSGLLDTMTGAEAMRRELQTAPACPMLSNVPCMHRLFNGQP